MRFYGPPDGAQVDNLTSFTVYPPHERFETLCKRLCLSGKLPRGFDHAKEEPSAIRGMKGRPKSEKLTSEECTLTLSSEIIEGAVISLLLPQPGKLCIAACISPTCFFLSDACEVRLIVSVGILLFRTVRIHYHQRRPID